MCYYRYELAKADCKPQRRACVAGARKPAHAYDVCVLLILLLLFVL